MNRILKFRAWDKENKYMIVIFDSVKQENWFIPSWTDRYVVMQYTGLKDKNGVEIYEGDILSRENSYENNCVIKWDNESCGFTINYIYYDETYGMCEFWDDFEIIGNIYEHKHLLEVE